MKKKLTLIFLSLIGMLSTIAQSISPVETGEFCPLQDITFTVTLPRIVDNTTPIVASWTNGPIVVSGISPNSVVNTQTQTTCTFVGRLGDVNINQVFKVDYITSNNPSASVQFQFKNIKSLFYTSPPPSTSCLAIQPNQASVSAAICQAVNIPISFNAIKWSTYGETPAYCFGSISTYEYKLPAVWKIGNAESTGSNWILSSNNATITSNLLGGGGSTIAIRPANNCGTNLNNNQIPVYVSIIRSNSPVLQVNGTSTLTLYCGDASAKTFTVVNAGACITGYEWLVANKGWYDASDAGI